MKFPCVYQLPKPPEEGYGCLHNSVVLVRTFNRDHTVWPTDYPIQLTSGKLCIEEEIIPLENAELPYIGNEFWWRLMRNQPRRVIVKETPTEDFPHFTVVDVENPHLVFAAMEDELRPV